ncbi:hypothetical protein [Natronorubrum sp. DTA7]|uniref:hypothetical protein n=1 Tax=Natronorubrum sp. DTA7 TaxID=3447016 RepID=UPI003F82DA9A
MPSGEGVPVYGTDGERRGEVALESSPTPHRSPAIAGGRLVVPTDDRLAAVGD